MYDTTGSGVGKQKEFMAPRKDRRKETLTGEREDPPLSFGKRRPGFYCRGEIRTVVHNAQGSHLSQTLEDGVQQLHNSREEPGIGLLDAAVRRNFGSSSSLRLADIVGVVMCCRSRLMHQGCDEQNVPLDTARK